MKTPNLWVPHIDKTGGQTVEAVLTRDLDAAGWKVDRSPMDNWDPANTTRQNYARLGMGNPLLAQMQHWYKLLIIRKPIDRFVSTYNYYKFESWLATNWFIDFSIEEYCKLVDERCIGYTEIAMRHLGLGHSMSTYENYVTNVLLKFPWAQIYSGKTFSTSIRSLNSFYQENVFSDKTVFDCFDLVIDTNRLDEIPQIMRQWFDVEVNMDLHENKKETNFNIINNGSKPLTVEDLTDREIKIITQTTEYKKEHRLWEYYKEYRDANN